MNQSNLSFIATALILQKSTFVLFTMRPTVKAMADEVKQVDLLQYLPVRFRSTRHHACVRSTEYPTTAPFLVVGLLWHPASDQA